MTTTPRVGVDGRELANGVRTGIGRYVSEVLRAASGAGWECVMYGATLDGDLPGVAGRALPERWTPWWDQVSLPAALARDRVSVFLSPYYKGPLAAPCPVVLTIHDLFFIEYLGRRRPGRDAVLTALARLYARRAAAVIADSEYSKRAIVERLGVGAAKVTVIPVALGAAFTPTPLTDPVRARYRLPGRYVLYVGNFKPHKNVDRLLRAYAALHDDARAGHALVLAGGDHARRPALETLAGALGVADRVVFTGAIADVDLPAVYSSAAVLVLPSLEEGFGLPALEAMACGAPVVAANRAALPEVVGDAALLVEPEDEGAIRSAVARVLASEESQEDLRQRGFARAKEFSSERTAGRVLALLREVSTR